MSTSIKPSYHHGDLRSALIEAGLTSLATRTADDLSLRELARTVGVSATAVYRHFPDKAALMTALALAGLEMLGAAQHGAFEAAGGGKAGFVATGIAYVHFAQQHTALFRLIFASAPSSEALELDRQRPDAMRFLMANAEALAPTGMEPRVFALQAWSVAHGLAMLSIDQQVAIDDETIERVIGGMSPAHRC